MAHKRYFIYIPAIATIMLTMMLFVFPVKAYCDDTDLKVKVETITRREYVEKAVTDGYGIEILTADGYKRAEEVSAMEKENTGAIQAELFSETKTGNTNQTPAQVEQLGLFDIDYEASDIQTSEGSETSRFILTGLVLFLATGLGIVLAIMWQKQRGTRTT